MADETGKDGASSIAKLFDVFYTRFVLRDIVGKVIPGLIFLLFIAVTVEGGSVPEIVRTTGHLSSYQAAALIGLSWLVALSMQGLNSRLDNFYFPVVLREARAEKAVFDREASFMYSTARTNEFLAVASPDEKAQYERFVVIKEACGNAFYCTAWGLVVFVVDRLLDAFSSEGPPWSKLSSDKNVLWIEHNLSTLVMCSILLASMYLMHKDHVSRQYSYANVVLARNAARQAGAFSYFGIEAVDGLFRWDTVAVFDIHGVILDDEDLLRVFMNEALEDAKIAIDEPLWTARCIGRSPREFIPELFPWLDAANVDRIIRKRDKLYLRDLGGDGGIVRHGFWDLLNYIARRDGVAAAVAFIHDRDAAALSGLKGLATGSSISLIVGVDDEGPGGNQYEAVKTRMGLDRRYVAFDDSSPGIARAKAAGMTVIAVPNRMTAAHDLSRADAVIEGLAPASRS